MPSWRHFFRQASALIVMSTLLLSLLGLSVGVQHCAVWREIAPCTCRKDYSKITSIDCQKMSSYEEVVKTLQNKFSPTDNIDLNVAFSKLEDLPQRSFKELNMTIERLKLNHDNLSDLSPYTFLDLPSLSYFSLADNNIGYVPKHIFEKLPNIKSLDLGRIGIHSIREGTFKCLPYLQNLILAGNSITEIDSMSIPMTVRQLHLGRNAISDLNGTLMYLTELEWLFINANNLTNLQDQLPITAPKLIMIHAADNKITKLPTQLKNYLNLQSLFMQNNSITSLGTSISKLRKLERIQFARNRINELSRENFAEMESLESILLDHNRITSLNNSLLPLRKLRVANITHNLLTEFSLQEIKGLQELRMLDLSHNKISKIYGPTANLVEWESKLMELRLDHNHLRSLNGALSGLPSLLRLDLSYNKITSFLPDDFVGLDQLKLLDVSHNQLTTLEEISKTFLPSLEELIASHNRLTVLDRDFHGLPVLCWADLSSNQIVALGRDLVSNTRCRVHGATEGTWGTLKVYLQDNPILCDAALSEIVAAMEKNHTRIYGVSHCAPLSEQPTTSKPNGFLGILPESTPIPLKNNFNSPPKLGPIFKQPIYQTLTVQEQPLINVNHQDINSDNRLINSRATVPIVRTYDYKPSEHENRNVDENSPEKNQIHQTHNHLRHHGIQTEKSSDYDSYPRYAYKLSNYSIKQNRSHVDANPFTSTEMLNVNPSIVVNEQQQTNLFVHSNTSQNENDNHATINSSENETISRMNNGKLSLVDQLSRQEQLLASEIEELKQKVKELSVQTERLNQEENLSPLQIVQSMSSLDTSDIRTVK